MLTLFETVYQTQLISDFHLFSTRKLGGLRVFSPEFARRKNDIEIANLHSHLNVLQVPRYPGKNWRAVYRNQGGQFLYWIIRKDTIIVVISPMTRFETPFNG